MMTITELIKKTIIPQLISVCQVGLGTGVCWTSSCHNIIHVIHNSIDDTFWVNHSFNIFKHFDPGTRMTAFWEGLLICTIIRDQWCWDSEFVESTFVTNMRGNVQDRHANILQWRMVGNNTAVSVHVRYGHPI